MTIKGIKSALLTKLQSLSTVATTSGYDVIGWNQFPAGNLMTLAGEAELAGTHHTTRTRKFNYDIYVDRTVWNPKQAEDLSVDILDEVEQALDRDITLSGLCNYAEPTAWTTGYEIRDTQTRVLALEISVREINTVR